MDTKDECDDLAAAICADGCRAQPPTCVHHPNCTTATTRCISKEYLPTIEQELHDQPRVAVRRFEALIPIIHCDNNKNHHHSVTERIS